MLLAIILVVAILTSYFSDYNQLISSKCQQNGSTASIAWKRTLPFFLIDGYLIIKGKNGDIIFNKLLVENRDHYGDLQVEFIGISWDCDKITLELNRNHYKGPEIIKFE